MAKQDKYLKKGIFFMFSESVKPFGEIAQIRYDCVYEKTLMLTLPIFVYYGDFFNKKLLFKSSFYTRISSVEEIEKLSNLNFSAVEEWFRENFPQETILKELSEKAELWISEERPESKTLILEGYKAGEEFLEVDEDTNFCGNFKQQGKEGCSLVFGENFHYNPLKSFLFEPYITEFDFPYEFRKENKIQFHKLSFKEIEELILSQGEEFALNIYKSKAQDFDIHGIEQNHCKYAVSVAGNDDTSYTKYFVKEEDMMDEIYRLRRCQPINLWIDILENGYHFTN